MGNRKLDQIMLRISIILTVIAVVCIIIVPKPSAELVISIVSCVIAFTVGVIAVIRMLTNKDK